jgi:hypothetical protein
MLTEYFKHAAHSPFFSFQNAFCLIILPFLVHVLFTFYIQNVLKFKNKFGSLRVKLQKTMNNPEESVLHSEHGERLKSCTFNINFQDTSYVHRNTKDTEVRYTHSRYFSMTLQRTGYFQTSLLSARSPQHSTLYRQLEKSRRPILYSKKVSILVIPQQDEAFALTVYSQLILVYLNPHNTVKAPHTYLQHTCKENTARYKSEMNT